MGNGLEAKSIVNIASRACKAILKGGWRSGERLVEHGK